ncbi:MAG: flippase-like domain-containing protein, partial [Desulfobacterales bacterium]|nr:flippase-like domain-containing protein [Desulfobacterales bacterium]
MIFSDAIIAVITFYETIKFTLILSFMKKRFVFSLFLGLLISAITLYLALKNVSFSEVAQSILNLDPLWILPSIAAILLSFVLRAVRWKMILKSSKDISFAGAYHPLMIGFMLNCVLPARAGEIARPVVLKKIENVPFSTGLASVAAERMFDIIILVIFFAVMFKTVHIDPELDIVFGNYHLNRSLLLSLGARMVKLGIIIICLMLLAGSRWVREKMGSIILSLPGIFLRNNQPIKSTIEQNICTPIIGF